MPQATTDDAPLTVVLVHGAFADASSWSGVIERLQGAGTQVTAPVDPLRGISVDSASIASLLNQMPRPVFKAAGTDVIRSMAERAGATITEAEGSHVIMVSQPGAVAEVIVTAAGAVGRPVAAAGG